MFILGMICAYLVGAIPFAYIFTKSTEHLDIRKAGSKNVGATNVLRVAGKKTAVLVLMLDILKGVVAVGLLASFFSNHSSINSVNIRLLFASCAVTGHIWPVYLNFKGGKGVATTLGVCAGLSFYLSEFRFLFLLAIVVWLLSFFMTRYVSVGSMAAALSIPIAAALKGFDLKIVILGIFLAALVVVKHEENIRRLLTRKETKLYFSKEKS